QRCPSEFGKAGVLRPSPCRSNISRVVVLHKRSSSFPGRLWGRGAGSSPLERFHGLGRYAPLRPPQEAGGDVGAAHLATPQKAMKLGCADSPATAEVRDAVTGLSIEWSCLTDRAWNSARAHAHASSGWAGRCSAATTAIQSNRTTFGDAFTVGMRPCRAHSW